MTEQVIFTNEDGEDIRFYVVEETKIAGVNYLLVTEQEDADSEAYIMKKVAVISQCIAASRAYVYR